MAIIYARQSKDRQGDGAAIDRQIAECRRLAARHNFVIGDDDILIDNDVSASKGARPGFTRLLESIRSGRTDTVIVWATDRLYRRLIDLAEVVALAEKHRLTILTVQSGDLDLSTPAGRMLAGMLGSAARFEVEQKGARQAAANKQRAGKGVWQFSRRPYGYRRDETGQVVLVPEEADLLVEGYERSLAGESGYSIVADWNDRGVRAQGGKSWSVSQLRERLSNPHYAGYVLHQGERVQANGVEVMGTHPAIVSPADYETVVRQIRARAARRTHDNRTKYLLSGISACGVCGERMFARPEYRGKSGKKMTYQCTSCWGVSRAMTAVDEVVERIIVTRLSLPDAASLLAPSVDVAPLLQEAAVLRERRDDLAALLAEGVLSRSAVRDQSDRLGARLDDVERAIGEAQGVGFLGAFLGADDIASRWRSASLSSKRELIRALCDVTVLRQPNPRVFDPTAIVVRWKLAVAA